MRAAMVAGGFVGRTAELAALDEWWGRARAGAPAAVTVAGPPGTGKTALVRRWLTGVSGARVVVATGDEAETLLQYGLVRQLAALLEHDGVVAAPGDAPLVVGSRLVEMLAQAPTETTPLVVVVDDAQWADQASLLALTFALRRLVAEPVLAVVTTRDPAGLPEGLLRLSDGDRGARLVLEGLTGHELVQLARALTGVRVSHLLGERLREHTGGNPLHARALLGELDVGSLSRAPDPLPAPRSFAALVLARLRSCSSMTQRLVTAAAVLGSPCPLSTVAATARVTDALPALQEAVDAGLLAESGVPGEILFPHALVRAAVYHDLGPLQRSTLHVAAAKLTPPPAALNHRIAAALMADGDLAAEVVRYAHEEAAAGMVTAAAGHLIDAARLTPDLDERQPLVAEAALELLKSGHVSEAASLTPQLATASPSSQRSLALGLLAFFGGRQDEAEQLLTEAWERCVLPADREVAALAGGFLAQMFSIQVRSDDTILWAERAMTVSDDPYLSPARSVHLCQLWFTGRWTEATELIDRGIRDLPGLASDAASELYMVRALTRLWTDDPAGARSDLARALHHCQPVLGSRAGLITLGYLAEAEFRTGHWDASLTRGTQAVSLAVDADQVWTSAFLNSMVALPLAGRGQWGPAEHHVRIALDAAAALGDVASLGHAVSAAMLLAACLGEPERVVNLAEPLWLAERRLALDYPGVHDHWQVLHAEALLDLGRHEDAEAVIAEYAATAASWGLLVAQAHAARLRGQLHAARREPDLASASFEDGTALLDGVLAPFERALLSLAHGGFLRRAGQRRAAADRLTAAAKILADLGARPFQRRCERELAACGLTPARRSRDDARDRLTPQELAVAHLVARGATNRAVATELVISTKTVEYHLANTYRKLGVSSRTELGARLPHTAPR